MFEYMIYMFRGLLPFALIVRMHSLTLCVHSNVLHYFLPVVFEMSITFPLTVRFSFLNYDNFLNHHRQNSMLVLMFLLLPSFPQTLNQKKLPLFHNSAFY